MGHYRDGGTTGLPYLECMQYYNGSAASGAVEPLRSVTPVDDENFLVDQFEQLLERSQREQRPFLAAIFFHGVHIPYVATPATRAHFMAQGMDANEADYWGTISQLDAAVGRIRQLLQTHGVANNTWLSVTADNGPEVSPAGGQGTASFLNPGRTAGLRGRKRDVTEGGTRVIGLVEFPPAIRQNMVFDTYPIVTMDIMSTILDLLQMPAPLGRPLDGHSLLPVLRGEISERPTAAGIGIHGSFPYGDTNHQFDPKTGRLVVPYRCPNSTAASQLGDIPANFSSAAHGWQFSWAEGNHLKIVGCNGYCNGNNCNSTAPGFRNNYGWQMQLFNLTRDPSESTDLWRELRPTAQAMLARFNAWQDSIRLSQGQGEIGCASGL